MNSLGRVIGAEFDGALAASLFDVAIEALELESTYVWGLFRTDGEEQHIVQVMRRVSPIEAWPPKLLLQSNIGASGMRRHRTALTSSRSRDVETTATETGLELAARSDDGAQPLQLTVDSHNMRWSEGQILDVTGREVTPGLQWCIVAGGDAGIDGHDPGMRYASRIFQVGGVFEGMPIAGFVGLDEVHLGRGRRNYVDDPITAQHLSQAWCTWATAYDDGTVEAGHAAFGEGGFGFGLLASGGSAHVASAVSGSVTADDAGRPIHIGFDIDGEHWEFVADERGLPVDPLPGPVRQAEGWFRRVGEQRRPIVWCATPEIPTAAS
jgi:hypothetical protein